MLILPPKSENHEGLLHGKTLQIYWYLLIHQEAGIREIQKKLGISSPSTVSYHINKLSNAKLISQSSKTGKYHVIEEVKEGVLGLYVKIGLRMIPRFVAYLAYFLVGWIVLTILLIQRADSLRLEDLLFWCFILSAILIFLFETLKVWRMKPL